MALLSAGACLGWLPFLGRSPSPDEGGFLLVGGQWSAGSSLYGDLWVDRPPGLIAVFGLADALGGIVPLRLMGALAAVATVVAAGLLGRLAAPGTRIGVLAPAAIAAILTASPLFGASVMNGELLGLPFLVGGMAMLVAAHKATTARAALVWGAAAGASGALGFLMKQSLVDVFVMALALALTRVRSVRVLTGLVLGAAATLGLAFAMASARGTDTGELLNALLTFRLDAAQVLARSNESTVGRFGALLLALLFSGAPLLVGTLGWRAKETPPTTETTATPDLRAPAYAVLAVEMVVVLFGGSYWLHYLMGVVPGLALLAAAAAQRPGRWGKPVTAAYAYAALSALGVIGWLGLHPIDRPEEPVIAYLERHAESGDSAVVAFGGPNILQQLELESPYPYLWSLPVRVRDRDLAGLTSVLAGPSRPTWVVVRHGSLRTWGLDFTEPQQHLDASYTLAADLGRFTIYRLDSGG